MPTLSSRRLIVKLLGDMLEKGTSAKKVGQILAAYLVENRKTRDRDLYLRDLRRELENRFGITSVEVKSASELTKGVTEQIEVFIKRQTNAKDVEILGSIDKSLIAGVVISTTDSELDGSLKKKIKELRMV
jgi:F0F1-type ATP synthase delta subunit